ncbi:MAG TPA: murein biosynthesis integral membrane protein MurJ [Dongiaceae bacterium]|nr:murein biosynthesis integral membrane protein MurJ [Dongiaceae bacterium]
MFSIRSVLSVGFMTLISRALGFVREMLIAHWFGTSAVADAWFVAQRLPNLFRRLFAEGAFNSAFVPMFAGRLEQGGTAEARAFAERVLAAMLVFMLLLTALAEIAMPLLILVFAPGFYDEPSKFALTVLLTSICFPYLLFMFLAALFGGILNSLHHFGHAAAAPILLNVVLTLGLIFVAPHLDDPVMVLAWGETFAGLLQFLWLYIVAAKLGYGLRLPPPRITAEIKQVAKLMVPGLISGGAQQISIAIATILSSLQDQAVSYLSYADRLYQLPLSLVGAAIGVVLLPVLARSIRGGREAEGMAAFNRSLEFGLMLILPSTVGLILAAEPIVRVVYERGEFSADATTNTALALMAISIGLPAYVLNKTLQPGFFARGDTVTPFRYSMITIVTDMTICIAFFFLLRPYGIGFLGIALGTGIASWLNCTLLYRTLTKRGFLVLDQRLKRNLPRFLIANLAMAGVLIGGQHLLRPWLEGMLWHQIGALCALVGAAAAAYFLLIFATGAYTLADFKRNALRR